MTAAGGWSGLLETAGSSRSCRGAGLLGHSGDRWRAGDLVGCFIDIDSQDIRFFLNGTQLRPVNQIFRSVK
jgi:hypothetical protein